MYNAYDNPERFGLEVVWQINTAGAYEFDIFCVWVDNNAGNNPTGIKVYYATDSGCSCPSPFENYEGPETLTRVENLEHLRRELKNFGEIGQNDVRHALHVVSVKTGWTK